MSSSQSSEIDKESLYGEFLHNQRWREKLSRRATHKALDMPDDEMQINVQKGMTWRELLILGLMFPAGLSAAAAIWRLMQPGAAPPADTPAAQVDTDSDTKYEFDVSAGKRPAP